MQFTNLPKKISPNFEPIKKAESVKSKTKTKFRISVKLRLIGVLLLLVIFILIGLKVLQEVNGFFEQHRLKFYPLVEVKFHAPIQVEIRQIISPLSATVSAVPKVPEVIPEVKAVERTNKISGKASYYSLAGCLGCDSERIMANGQKLKDEDFTIALTPEMVHKYRLLNDNVSITNQKNGNQVIAKVTDTGGFAKYGRIADLSVATKNALGCGGTCDITIAF